MQAAHAAEVARLKDRIRELEDLLARLRAQMEESNKMSFKYEQVRLELDAALQLPIGKTVSRIQDIIQELGCVLLRRACAACCCALTRTHAHDAGSSRKRRRRRRRRGSKLARPHCSINPTGHSCNDSKSIMARVCVVGRVGSFRAACAHLQRSTKAQRSSRAIRRARP
jgi:hypothetical protein